MLCAPLERHIKYLISDNDFGSTLSIFTLKLQWRASNKLGLICYWWCEGHARQEHLCGNQADSKVPRQSMTSRCSWRRSIISTVSPKRILQGTSGGSTSSGLTSPEFWQSFKYAMGGKYFPFCKSCVEVILYGALNRHFENAAEDQTRNSKERQT